MRQVILKASFNVGWASHDYRIGLGGQGNAALAETFGASFAKVVVPVAGTFRNLMIYSPASLHPAYTVKVMKNGVVTALTCALAATESLADDRTNSFTVVAGDDIYVSVDITTLTAGTGYPLNISLEFEGNFQFYGITPEAGGVTVDTTGTGGALGNGIFQSLSSPASLSNTYSICAAAGTLTGIRMKTYSTNVGGSWVGYISKNQVLQDGSGGTVNTACTLTDGDTQATSSFSLPIALGDHLDFALTRLGTSATFQLANVAMSVIFNPTVANSFMCCGGSNDANAGPDSTEFKWVHSEQQQSLESVPKCPIGPRGIVVSGLRIELPIAPTVVGTSRIFTIRKNGVDTAATVTITGSATSAVISGLSITFADSDFIDLEITNVGNPTVSNGMKWGLSETAYTDRSGIYFLNLTKAERHDSYYGDVEKKIPNPTVRTALLGE